MANKQRLQGLITTPTAPAEPVPPPEPRTAAYPIGRLPQPDDLALTPQAEALSAPLQVLAQKFIGARRRSGEALLEAARWLHEARNQAKHGEWGIFLAATNTSDDAAERLLNIHTLAMSDQRFADAVARNWLSQSVAADLARPSTPPEARNVLLEAEQPPSRAEAQRAIKQARGRQHPPTTDPVASSGAEMQNPHNADFAQHLAQNMQDVATLLTTLAQHADAFPRDVAVQHAVDQAEVALTAIRRAVTS